MCFGTMIKQMMHIISAHNTRQFVRVLAYTCTEVIIWSVIVRVYLTSLALE